MDFREIKLMDGFWHDIYERNAKVSIYSVKKRFEESGRFEALRFTHGKKPDVPLHFFFDSDAAKWIEAVAYLLCADREGYRELEDFCDALIDDIAKNQREDGYFNSFFQQKEPDKIFTNRDRHELYCMGHLIEAAVAYDAVTGKDKFLLCAKKMADCIERVFITEKSAPYLTGGHEELKIALLKLYEHTGDGKYLKMAEHFVNIRGANEADKGKTYELANEFYHQDNAPARALCEADGHAVRALYYYTAMADLAAKTNDEQLKEACRRLYENITQKKMYITGGVGSTRIGESFASEYSLPNSTAYSESCAAIAMLFFCYNMLSLEHNAKYSDTVERVLYNSFLSSTSLDGKAFFYENPLEINLAERDVERSIIKRHRQKFPIAERVEIFGCSCCPPNINRVCATIAKYAYTEDSERLYIEQFMSSKIEKYGITVNTDYPRSGEVNIVGRGYPCREIAVRIPAWCDKYTLSRDAKIENGYAVFSPSPDFDITLKFEMTASFVYSDTRVFSNIGRVAVTYGPLVFAAEGCDNGGCITDLLIDTSASVERVPADFHPLFDLVADGVRVKKGDALYSREKPQRENVKIRLVPYCTFANRGAQNMQVWINELN